MSDLMDDLREAWKRREAARAEAAARNAAWEQHMTAMTRESHDKLDKFAKAEGWAIFTYSNDDATILQIQALDDPDETDVCLAGGDGEAYALVARKAAEGSKPHILALYLDGRLDDEISVPKSLLDW